MTKVTLKTYAASDVTTPLATLTQRRARWQWEAKRHGSGKCDVPESTDDADILPGAIVAVYLEGITDPVFGWVIDDDPIVSDAKNAGAIQLGGLGLRRILDYGQVWPPDCPGPADEIVFGWQHPAYTLGDHGPGIGAWTLAQSHGTVGSQPFNPARPTGYPVKEAAFITDETNDGSPRTVRFLRTYTFAADTQIGIPVSQDDELPEMWINGVRIDELQSTGKYQWKGFRYVVLDICAGDVTFAAKVVNLPSDIADDAATNPLWFLLAGVQPAGDGIASASDEQVTVNTGASTTGTWIGLLNGTPTGPIAFDASQGDVAAAVETALGDPVTVEKTSSAPHSWTITIDGPKFSASPVIFQVQDIDLDGTLSSNTTREGASGMVVTDDNGDPIITDTSWATHTGDIDPGMTPGHIVRICVEDAAARGVTDLDHVTFGFTDTEDSAGNPWPDDVVLRVPMQDVTVGRVVEMLEAMGFVFDVAIRSGELVVDGWVANGRGDDLSGSIALARSDIQLGQLGRRHDTIRNVIRSVLADGFHDTDDAASIAAYGRREATSADAVFESSAEADQYAQADLDNLAEPQEVSQFAVSPGADRPYLDGYGEADVITCPARSGQISMRVVGITGEVEGRTALKLSIKATS